MLRFFKHISQELDSDLITIYFFVGVALAALAISFDFYDLNFIG